MLEVERSRLLNLILADDPIRTDCDLLGPLGSNTDEVRHTQASAEAGVVEFVARCRDARGAQRIHEISRFVCEAGRWYYIDGQTVAAE